MTHPRLWILLVLLFAATAFGQSRDFTPPTPEETQQRITGEKADEPNPYKRQYELRMYNNPNDPDAKADKPRRGRSPFVVRNDDGSPIDIPRPEGGSTRLIQELDQYMMDVEFNTPNWVEVRMPDGSSKIFWYMIFTARNWQEFPVYGRLTIWAKAMAQDIFPDPQGMQPDQEAELQKALLKEFVGEPGEGGVLSARGLEEHKDELLRGIKRAIARDYLSYSDRAILDAICVKERLWGEDQYNRLFNSLVPMHHFQWRTRLMPKDENGAGYYYEPLVIIDHKDRHAYVVTGVWKGKDTEPGVIVRTMKYGNREPSLDTFDSLSAFKSSRTGTQVVNLRSESTLNPEAGREMEESFAAVKLWEAVLRYWPRYQKGQRVDQYGFILRPGNPDYENGILLNSEHTILNGMYGAQLEEINTNDGPYKGFTLIEGPLTLDLEDRNKLPECNGQKLVAVPAESMMDLATVVNVSQSELEQNNPALWNAVQNTVKYLTDERFRNARPDRERLRTEYQTLIAEVYRSLESKAALPDIVAFRIQELVRQSRLYFVEAAGQDAKLMGRQANGFLWDAAFRPAVCYVKHAAPRRFKEGDRVLRNFKCPAAPLWETPQNPDYGKNLNRPIGAKPDELDDPRNYVNGMIIERYEFGAEDDTKQPLHRSPKSRFGDANRTEAYGSALVQVENKYPWFDDYGRDEGKGGRPVKRQNHLGRTLWEGHRVYMPGDRVTPMEWEAYASLLTPGVLRDYEKAGGYDPARAYLRVGDLLVGQPRLILTEWAYEPFNYLEKTHLMPKGRLIDNQLPGTQQVFIDGEGKYWRHGFRCDAFGDYDALVYEELSADGKRRFDDLLANTLRESKMNPTERASTLFLKLVPKMDRHGVAQDWVNPLHGERIPQRKKILPASDDDPDEVILDATKKNIVWAKAYEYLPVYLYEYDYEAITPAEAEANYALEDSATFNIDELVTKAKAEQEKKRKGEGGADALPATGLSEREVKDKIDDAYWGNEMGVRKNTNAGAGLVGLFKVDDRPTLGPCRTNYRTKKGDKIAIPMYSVRSKVPMDPTDEKNEIHKQFDQVTVRDNRGVGRVVEEQEVNGKKVYKLDLNHGWHEHGVVYLGKILEGSNTSEMMFEVEKEIVPAEAIGVAVFGEMDQNWDYLNVYVSGIKGPIKRYGMNPVKVTDDGMERLEYAPRYMQENWMLMLRFQRSGDEFKRHQDRVTFVRQYWYLPKDPEELKLRE